MRRKFNSHTVIQIFKCVILVVCLIVTTYQVTTCFQKLRYPPVSTHSKIVLNESMTYPALTICRYPAFKQDILEKYGLPLTISDAEAWSKFNFNQTRLEQIWSEGTYNLSETISSYAIASVHAAEYVHVVSKYYFYSGQCHTIIPKAKTKYVNLNSGLKLTLKGENSNNTLDEPGWNIYIHDTKHPWIENMIQTEEVVENYFLDTSNDYYFKLSASGFKLLNSEKYPCSHDEKASRNDCKEICRWQHIVHKVGCTAPWFYDLQHPGSAIQIPKLPNCNTYPQLAELIDLYKNFSNLKEYKKGCYCPQPCLIRLYQMYPVKHNEMMRYDSFNSYSKLNLYFTTKMVNIIEEMTTYDINNFLADLGGSLGFLLGLSVLGVIDLMEQGVKYVNINISKDYSPGNEKNVKNKEEEMVCVKTISKDKEYFKFWDSSLLKKL